MTNLALPEIDQSIMTKKADIISNLKKIINSENVLSEDDEIKVYETDALLK
jgi:glycolate oxidase